MATLQAEVDAIQLELETGTALTDQQLYELSLVTAQESILGSIAELSKRTKARREENADATIAAAINANRANVGLSTEVRVRNEADLALAQQITTVNAAIGVTNANVTSLTQAVADGDSALATQINTVTSQVAGNTASISVLTSSVDGVLTRFAVTLNANNEITGFIQLDGSVTGSNFIVAVDNFQVAKVGTTGGDAVPVFQISTVAGVAKLTLRGDMIADGTIIARAIAAGSITADKIAVSSLSALSANIGTVTAGIIRNPANTAVFDAQNMRWYRVDGKAEIDLLNGKFKFTP